MKKILIAVFITTVIVAFDVKEGVIMAQIKEVQLPQPAIKGRVSLEEAIAKRRSQRSFTSKRLNSEQIGQLLWAAQGITGKKLRVFRSAPSAGALYPMEIYALTGEGFYHYIPEKHALEVLKETDLRKELSKVALSQSSVKQAVLSIVICAVYERVTSKYAERGKRYVLIEAGHIAQNIHLQAVALGLGSVPVGAFDDAAVKKILNLPQEHEPLYIIPVGYAE